MFKEPSSPLARYAFGYSDDKRAAYRGLIIPAIMVAIMALYWTL